jgi:hypothetical protein
MIRQVEYFEKPGSGKGADTVAIVQAHPSDRFLDVRVRQILAKPL